MDLIFKFVDRSGFRSNETTLKANYPAVPQIGSLVVIPSRSIAGSYRVVEVIHVPDFDNHMQHEIEIICEKTQ